jgi:pyoverdine/dityrosine biosynthesis protein Dit1
MDIRNIFNYPEENNYMVASNDEDITNCIIEELRPQKDEDATSDNDDNVEPLKISTHQAQEYLEGLTLFWMQQKESYHEFSESLKEQKEVVKKISMTCLKQKSVLNYFSSV